MKSSDQVLAKAEHLNGKVVVVTRGTSPLGELTCRYAALVGAKVFALDVDAAALAHLAISFRQNQLRLRGVPFDLSSEDSIANAIDEITSHAPPIDLWIHAESLSKSALKDLEPTLRMFGQHFDRRGKGSVSLLLGSPSLEKNEAKFIESSLQGQASKIVTTVNLIAADDKTPELTALQLLKDHLQGSSFR